MFHHIETSLLICSANQRTGFYMMGTVVVEKLRHLPWYFSQNPIEHNICCAWILWIVSHPAQCLGVHVIYLIPHIFCWYQSFLSVQQCRLDSGLKQLNFDLPDFLLNHHWLMLIARLDFWGFFIDMKSNFFPLTSHSLEGRLRLFNFLR